MPATTLHPRGRVAAPAMTGRFTRSTLERRTKIVATLGPATDAPGVLDALIAAGLDCARLNCSHGTAEDLSRRAEAVRTAAARAGRPLGVMFDLQGPKLRLAADTVERSLRSGDRLVLSEHGRPGAADRAVVDFKGFSRLVTDRSEIVIGDGVPRLAVEHTSNGDVHARVIADGRIAPSKGVNVTFAQPELPAITEKDVADIALAVEHDADFVAQSFVRHGADVEDLRWRLNELGSRARIIAKLESVEGYDNLDSILAAADGVMVARGDYGVTAGLAGIPLMQKDVIARAAAAGKAVITATQMLESMIVASEPTRAEVTDVANAVIDGTSAVMLSAESSVGQHPVRAVAAMATIAHAAEAYPDLGQRSRSAKIEACTSDDAVMHAAVQLADELRAAAIVVPTASGASARACSRYRPRQPIVALAHDAAVAEQLTLEWGVYPVAAEIESSLDDLVEVALDLARDFAGLRSGDRIVVTHGRQPGASGSTNAIIDLVLP
ncbi:pyruvate kinase [Solirubrobacter pauli]|nr:pyruvate kinase [Solirubrobacter pauli]